MKRLDLLGLWVCDSVCQSLNGFYWHVKSTSRARAELGELGETVYLKSGEINIEVLHLGRSATVEILH